MSTIDCMCACEGLILVRATVNSRLRVKQNSFASGAFVFILRLSFTNFSLLLFVFSQLLLRDFFRGRGEKQSGINYVTTIKKKTTDSFNWNHKLFSLFFSF